MAFEEAVDEALMTVKKSIGEHGGAACQETVKRVPARALAKASAAVVRAGRR